MSRLLSLLLIVCACAWTAAAEEAVVEPGADPDVLEFAFVSDTHGYGPSADVRDVRANAREFVRYVNAHPSIRFALFGGDMMNSYDTNHEQAMWCLRRAAKDFVPLNVPIYFTKGNHDVNGKQRTPDGRRDNTQIVTDREYHALFSPVAPTSPFYHPEGIVIDPEWPEGNYYYRDFPEQKFRLIVLNNYCLDSLEAYGYHGQQMKWLAETALDFDDKETPEDWCFLLLGHAFSVNFRVYPIIRLMHAYTRGQDFSDSDRGVTYGARYSRKRRAQIVGMACGHFHEDIYDNRDGYNLIVTHRGFATEGEVGTEEAVSFDHFVLNTRTKTLEQRRVGRGISHLYSYESQGRMLEPHAALPALDGEGSFTHGGRGGRRIHVTNLRDSGRGSLRWAVSQSGCREILFDVAGTIRLRSPLVVDHDSITIYGQSSPAEGITLRGAPLVLRASQAIVCYLTLRDGLRDGDFGQHDVVLSHLTVLSSTGDALVMRRTYRATVEHCLIDGAGPGAAGLVAGGCLVTYCYNYVCDCATAIRFPDTEGENHAIHIARNYLTRWTDHCMTGGGRQGEITISENQAEPDPGCTNLNLLDVAVDGTGRYYVKYNRMTGREQLVRRNELMVGDRSGMPYIPDTSAQARAERLRMHPLARPHKVKMARSCLSISAFQSKYLFEHQTANALRRRLSRLAGASYRPVPVCRDSLRQERIEDYLHEVVRPERSIVILFDGGVEGSFQHYPYMQGFRQLFLRDTATVGIVSAGGYLPRRDFSARDGRAATPAAAGGNPYGTDDRAMVGFMWTIGYDAIVPPAVSPEHGTAALRRLLQPVASAVTSVDLRDAEGDTLLFAPFVVRQYDRRRVAFIGVSGASGPVAGSARQGAGLGSPDGGSVLRAGSALCQSVQRAVDAVRSQGVDCVVVLTSDGVTGPDGHEWLSSTTGIDIVVDGAASAPPRVGRVADRDGRQVLVAHSVPHLEQIGKLVIDPDGGVTCEYVPLSQVFFRAPQTLAIVDSIEQARALVRR